MADNKAPWMKNLDGAIVPLVMPGKVQAGSTQTIKRGEICVYNETSGYFEPLDAVADAKYSLAISAEEQKSDDAERYMAFYMPREGDVFEFALSAAAQVALGDALIPVASQSQQLARDVDGTLIAVSVGTDNIPDTGTTLTSKSYVQAVIHPEYSYYYKNVLQRSLKKVIHATAALTLKLEDCGAVVTNKGASGSVTLTAPNAVVPVGWHFYMAVMADQAFVFDPKPDTAKVYIAGAAQTAGNYISMTDIGDYAMLLWDGTDWLAINSISGADGDITVET